MIITSNIIIGQILEAIDFLSIKPAAIITDDKTSSYTTNVYDYMDSNDHLAKCLQEDIDSKEISVILYTKNRIP